MTRIIRELRLFALVAAAVVALAMLAAPATADDPIDPPPDYEVAVVETRPTCDDGMQARTRYDTFGFLWNDADEVWYPVLEDSLYTRWKHDRALTAEESGALDCGRFFDRTFELDTAIYHLRNDLDAVRANLAYVREKADNLRDRLTGVKARKDARIERLLDRLHH